MSTPSGMLLFMKCHGALAQARTNGAIQLTVAGRLFAICFLVQENLLTAEEFAKARTIVVSDSSVGLETNRMIARLAAQWLKDHEEDRLEGNYPETDMSLNSIRALLALVVASQENFEAALKERV